MNKLSVVIINYNTAALTTGVVKRLFTSAPDLVGEVILVDNGSTEKLDRAQFSGLPVSLIQNEQNLGFAPAANQGIKASKNNYILLLNSDVLIEPDALKRLTKYFDDHPRAGIVGPQFIFPDGRWQSSLGRYPTLRQEFLRLSLLYKIIPGGTFFSDPALNKVDLNNSHIVDWISGGCMLVRKAMPEEIGLFDENYFLGVEDIDLCFRAQQAGWGVIYLPLAKVIHYHGYSSGGTRSLMRLKYDRDGILYFMKKYNHNILSRLLVKIGNDARAAIVYAQNFLKSRNLVQPLDATIAITYKCNSRCQMCNIWQTPQPLSLPLNVIDNLSPHLKYINLSGGEPFLHDNLIAIVAKIKEVSPRAQVIISSNGLATNLIITVMKKILTIMPNIGIRISIDGLPATHNAIRNVPNIYEQAMATIKGLKEIGVKNFGISFTIMDKNVAELKEVYDWSRANDLELALALVQNSAIYFQKQDNRLSFIDQVESGLGYIINRELKSFKPKRWARAFYDHGLKLYALKEKRLLASGAGFDSLFIDPTGNIYPSNLINLPMGNLTADKLDKIWQDPPAAAVRHEIKSKNITESWIICTIRGEMRKHIFKVLFWMAKNKVKIYEDSSD